MNRKRIKKILLWNLVVVILLAIAALVGGAFYMLDYALTPYKRSHKEAIERFYEREPANLKEWVDSLQNTNCLHDTSIVIDGRGTMHAIFLRASEPTNKVAVLLHGYNDRAESMLHIAYIYNHNLGYNVLLPHFFAHGDSEGDHIGMGWLDRNDMLRWMQVANEMFRGDSTATQMAVHGISMGAATAMCISGEKCPQYVKCFVEDCGYTSVWDEFASELHNQFELPEFPLMHLTSALCKMRYGCTLRRGLSGRNNEPERRGATSSVTAVPCHLPLKGKARTMYVSSVSVHYAKGGICTWKQSARSRNTP